MFFINICHEKTKPSNELIVSVCRPEAKCLVRQDFPLPVMQVTTNCRVLHVINVFTFTFIASFCELYNCQLLCSETRLQFISLCKSCCLDTAERRPWYL